MIFSMLVVAAVMPGLALRPQHSNTASFARLAESMKSGTTDQMAFLKDASSVVHDVLLQAGNATEHLNDDDKELLETVKVVIKNMTDSMKESQKDAEGDLERRYQAILDCNVDIESRQSPTGDLGVLHNQSLTLQQRLDSLRDIVKQARQDNDTQWGEFKTYMDMLKDPDLCPEFPRPKGMAQLDVYFKSSRYSMWWTATGKQYSEYRSRYVEADRALRDAIASYNIQKATLDVKYCDYKAELEDACLKYEQCHASKVDLYKRKVADVEIIVAKNLKIIEAAETLLAQVKFLLGETTSRETPPYNTKEWEVDYKEVPGKSSCDLSKLTSPSWNPPIKCFDVTDFMDGVPVNDGDGIRASCSGYDPTQAHGGTIRVLFEAEDGDIILTFGARWGNRAFANGVNEDHVVRNSKINRRWGPEETGGGWPLGTIGSPFNIDFVRTESHWEVSINGHPAPQFNYEHRTLKPVAKVVIETDKEGGIEDARVQLLRLSRPAPLALSSIQPAWDNHFHGFGAGVGSTKETVERTAALDKIMLDYDENSIVSIWDAAKTQMQNCMNPDEESCSRPNVEHKGLAAIRGMFDGLFDGLQGCTDKGIDGGLDAKLKVVEPTATAPGSVFLVWECKHQGFHKATDTFVFDGVKIRKQNIVVETTSSKASSSLLQAGVAIAHPPTLAVGGNIYQPDSVQSAWDNHFSAFGKGANGNVGDAHTDALNMIMKDYTDSSVVHIAAYEVGATAIPDFQEHVGLIAIRQMFKGLFDSIADTCNLGAPLVEVTGDADGEAKQVFLVWKIPASNYKWATDTFVFDDDLKIIKQNIVVVSAQKDTTGC